MSYLDYEGNRMFYEETGEGKPLLHRFLHSHRYQRQLAVHYTWR